MEAHDSVWNSFFGQKTDLQRIRGRGQLVSSHSIYNKEQDLKETQETQGWNWLLELSADWYLIIRWPVAFSKSAEKGPDF